MPRSLLAVLCSICLLASAAHAQSPALSPVRVAAGTVLKFHLQTRLKPTADDSMDAMPKGTVLQVKMLDAIDSDVDRDGTEFHGSLAAPLVLGDDVVVPAEAEVRGLLVLLQQDAATAQEREPVGAGTGAGGYEGGGQGYQSSGGGDDVVDAEFRAEE